MTDEAIIRAYNAIEDERGPSNAHEIAREVADALEVPYEHVRSVMVEHWTAVA